MHSVGLPRLSLYRSLAVLPGPPKILLPASSKKAVADKIVSATVQKLIICLKINFAYNTSSSTKKIKINYKICAENALNF
jgi:hypothetical protein